MVRKSYAIVSTILLLMGVSAARAGELRVWKSQSGDYEVSAKLVSSGAESVKLRTEEGREIEIELAKLSAADQEFVAQVLATKDTEKEIRRTLLQFYRAVQREPDGIRSFLTEAGQATFDGNRSFFEKLRGPDQNHRIGIGKINVDGQRAVAEYRLRLEGEVVPHENAVAAARKPMVCLGNRRPQSRRPW